MEEYSKDAGKYMKEHYIELYHTHHQSRSYANAVSPYSPRLKGLGMRSLLLLLFFFLLQQ